MRFEVSVGERVRARFCIVSLLDGCDLREDGKILLYSVYDSIVVVFDFRVIVLHGSL
jgi:hypothetical protein